MVSFHVDWEQNASISIICISVSFSRIELSLCNFIDAIILNST